MAHENPNEAPVVFVTLVRRGGADIDVDLGNVVINFTYEDTESKADKAKFTINNSDLSNFDKPLWKKGARIRVQWGYLGNMSPPRTVIVESVKGFSQLSIEAHDEAVLMNKTKRPRVFRDMTRSDVALKIAEEYGFAAPHRFIQVTGQTFPQISQAGMTDAELLAKLAAREGKVFFIDFDGFHWHEQNNAQKPIRRYVYGAASQLSECILGEPQIDNDITVPRYKGVRRKGINKTSGKPFDACASNTETDRDGLSSILDNIEDVGSSELDLASMEANLQGVVDGGGGTTEGVELSDDQEQNQSSLEDDSPTSTDIPDVVPEDAYLEDVDPRDKTTSLKINMDAGFTPIDEEPSSSGTEEEAKKDADAKYKTAQNAAVKLKFDVLGDPSLLAKTVVRFECRSPRITGLYYVKKVTHTISRGSYVCTLETQTDGGNTNGGAKSKAGSAANVNKSTEPAGEDELAPRDLEIVDGATKETQLVWTDARGREFSSMEAEFTDAEAKGSFTPAS